MNRNRFKNFQYFLADFLVTYLIWLAFVLIRRDRFEGYAELDVFNYVAAATIGIFWTGTYAVAGLYTRPYRRSRFHEFIQVFKYTLMGVLVLFFLIFLDDPVPKYQSYRVSFTTYLGLQFGAVATLRLIMTTYTNIQVRKRKIVFPTVIVGSGKEAYQIYHELQHDRRAFGYHFKGYFNLNGQAGSPLQGQLKNYGELDQLEEVILSRKIEDVIIALEKEDSHRVGEVIEICERTPANIKVVPGIYDYIVGSVKVSHIMGAPLVEVFPQIMKPWERVSKRAFDIVASFIALLILSPIFSVLAILIKADSPGPVFFRQERIGKGAKPFFIWKFRSMFIDAEKAGPALSSDRDPRITNIGLMLRKLRLDELPQFWNVLKGEMSIVGPRPERQFYIDKIAKIAPHYRHLHKIRPGITSWGQVKYGYAENVAEMVERLKFDILYMENMSLGLDIKIMLYTIIVIVEGRGK